MIGYIIKRLLSIFPVLLFIIFLVFSILELSPGDPAAVILGMDASEEAIARFNSELGLDQPFLMRFFNYIKDIATRLDFGESYRTRTPVTEDILPKFPTTLRLALFSVVVTAVIGIPLGIVQAVRQYSILDISLTVTSLIFASIPGFFLGLILVLIFSLYLEFLPSNGIGSLQHYIMPVLTLSLPNAAFLARLTRNQMHETLRQDYIRTAKAKGAGKRRIIWKHALRNGMMPVITMLGMTLASLLGGAMIVEIVFGMPGIGSLILNAIQLKDMPLVMGSTILLSTMFMLVMLIVDIIYAALDPRIKAQMSK